MISADRLPTDAEVVYALDTSVSVLKEAVCIYRQGWSDSTKQIITNYFKKMSAERYYFDWRAFRRRFQEYQSLYPEARQIHFQEADYQIRHFAPETAWQLPFLDLMGRSVTAYELRHLARQHRAFDMALVYYYHDEEPRYLNYFVRQVADLNRAFTNSEYDDAGNAIYESFRAGLRVQNWLFCHHVYLASSNYSTEMQYLLIKTLLHHGAQLQKRTKRYQPGNHHTKGLVALFEIATCFPEFYQTSLWQKQAVEGLLKHLENEVNPDGFQFERSVHYHKGDIENYFRVYQLAQINHYALPEVFRTKLYQMFDALTKLAQPNRCLPVLQDDTERPLAENNTMDDVMIVGAILFQEPRFKYLASPQPARDYYWLLRREQLVSRDILPSQVPTIGSVALPESGYYIMRNGWQLQDCFMAISAGLSPVKPDHQHADMLGVVAYANGHEILPNYQVSYNDPQYIDFKNSWVKNVAIVDNIPQGENWQPNEGQSGFGKWRVLPIPQVIAWKTNPKFDYFAGTHDRYENIGVQYYREVLFIKDGFWLIRDHFRSDQTHNYQQIWQGDFVTMGKQSIRRVFTDNSELEIRQLTAGDYIFNKGAVGSKPHILVTVSGQKNWKFTSLLIPSDSRKKNAILEKGWSISTNSLGKILNISEIRTDARCILTRDKMTILLDCNHCIIKKQAFKAAQPFSMILIKDWDAYILVGVGFELCEIEFDGKLIDRETGHLIAGRKFTLKPAHEYILP